MSFYVERFDNIFLVKIVGRLDSTNVTKIKNTWLEDDTAKYILIDLSETNFIDSMGLAALVSALKTSRQRGGNLMLLDPSQPIRNILELTAMSRVFEVAVSQEAAIARLKSSS